MAQLKLADKFSEKAMIYNLQQVYSRRPAQGCPDWNELNEAVSMAHSKPGSVFEMPWRSGPGEERYLLSVQIAPHGKLPSWYLSKWSNEQERVAIWAVSSSDLVMISQIVQYQTSHGEQYPSFYKSGLFGEEGFIEAEQRTAVEVKRLTGEFDQPLRGRLGTNILIGDLLVRAELIKPAQLAEALPIAKRTGLPVGRILIESGNVDERTLRATVLAQSLIRDGLLHAELAVKALRLLADTPDLNLEAALKRLDWRSEYYQTTNKLGNILLDAECIDRNQLAVALEVCFASGLPLGRVLVLRKIVPEVVAYAALSAQVLLREGKIPRNEAIAAVKLAASMKISIQEWLEHGGMLPATEARVIRLGELLSLAGIVSELDLLSAVERGLLEERPIGQILIRAGLIDDKILQIGLELQARVNKRELGSFQAASMLSDAVRGGKPEAQKKSLSTREASQERGLTNLLSLVGLSDADDPKALLHEVLIQKQNLAYKVVSQHEEVKHRLARDLHDTIIADLLMLRRYLAGDRKLTTEEIMQIIDDVVRQLREICNDFAPRNLHDWGLQMTLQDLAERLRLRTGIDCVFSCNATLPVLPEPVQLHIFRIVQECMNNIEKYAKASQSRIQVDWDQKTLRFIVSDNGAGFGDKKETREDLLESGGTGMQGMQERVELIRCYFPAKLTLQSVPGKGLTVSLELSLS
jgi:signal transduction histidine kinase